MKRTSSLLILSFIFFVKANGQFTYLNPKPNASFINPQTTIAIKNGELIDEASLRKKEFIAITGSISGKHGYTSRLSDDGKTIMVHPTPIFKCGETVTVEISNRLKKKSGELIQGTSFSFQIREEITAAQEQKYKQALKAFYSQEDMDGDNSSADLRTENLDSLPTYTITTNTNPAPGQIFFKNINNFLPVDTNGFATIIENNGDVTWAHKLKTAGIDFKINYNGYITYFNDSTKYWIVLDSNYNKIDSLQCGNGLADYVDSHDIAMYADKHSLLLVNDIRTMDLTQYGGKVDATVTGVKIQELDSAKDVVWEWNGWDYFNVDDAVSTVIITGFLVDYVHANAVSRDVDGNIILSSRNLDEITKIDRATGNLIWRMNGENNQFTFINDNIAEHFAHQHDAHRIANGNMMLFNNANFLTPQKSSSKEYALDETNKTATLVWYYEHPDVNGIAVYSNFMGNSQRLANGNTIINWGAPSSDPGRPTFTEVDSNKNIVWEMKFDEYGQKSYRMHKYVWIPCEIPKLSQITVTKITNTTAKVNWNAINNAASYDLKYRKSGKVTWKVVNTTNKSKKLQNLSSNTAYEFKLRTNCLNGYVSDYTALGTFTTLPAKLIEEQGQQIEFEIYPNPTQGLVFLKSNSSSPDEITFSVFDLEGRIVFSAVKIILPEAALKVDLSDLPAGIYLAKIKMQTIAETVIFVKQ